jgi:hypothetical protein
MKVVPPKAEVLAIIELALAIIGLLYTTFRASPHARKSDPLSMSDTRIDFSAPASSESGRQSTMSASAPRLVRVLT